MSLSRNIDANNQVALRLYSDSNSNSRPKSALGLLYTNNKNVNLNNSCNKNTNSGKDSPMKLNSNVALKYASFTNKKFVPSKLEKVY